MHAVSVRHCALRERTHRDRLRLQAVLALLGQEYRHHVQRSVAILPRMARSSASPAVTQRSSSVRAFSNEQIDSFETMAGVMMPAEVLATRSTVRSSGSVAFVKAARCPVEWCGARAGSVVALPRGALAFSTIRGRRQRLGTAPLRNPRPLVSDHNTPVPCLPR